MTRSVGIADDDDNMMVIAVLAGGGGAQDMRILLRNQYNLQRNQDI